MLTTSSSNRSQFRPESYQLKKSQSGPRKSPDAITMGGSQHSIGYKDSVLVSRQNDGEWQPIKTFEEVATTIKAASTPDAKVEIGAWEDDYTWGIYRDGAIQEGEVKDLWDRHYWDSTRHSQHGVNDQYYSTNSQPQEAYIANERYTRATLQIPVTQKA